MSSYRTVREAAACEQLIKKSRFIGQCQKVESGEEALSFIDDVSDANANHNCWAYKIGQAYRFDDDGEPGGTAGQPILSAIDGARLDHVAVVVTRYFGGVKLGAGGLVRAYRGTAASCLRGAGVLTVHGQTRLVMRLPFDCIGTLRRLTDKYGATIEWERFEADGVIMEAKLNNTSLDQFRDEATELSSGRCKFNH